MALVLLTHLDLTGLSSKTYGIYQRFRVLVEASQRVDEDLTIVCGIKVDTGSSVEEVEQQSRRDLLECWSVGARVVCVACADPPAAPWLLQQFKSAAAYRWRPLVRSLLYPGAMRRLQEVCRSASRIVVHRLPLMFCLMRAGPVNAPIYFDLDDIEYIALWRHSKTHPSRREKFFIRLGLPAVYMAMWSAVKRARCTFVCSELDRARLARRLGASVRVVPNSAPVVERVTPIPAAPILLMVGVYSFRPNADGADHFIEAVWPRVLAEMPDAQLWLAGTGAEQLRTFPGKPRGVRFLGFVPDLDAVYQQARLVVCPLRSGGGTRVKLLEAAAHGRPIVSTAVGAEGIGFEPGVDALIADAPHEFAAACLTALRDDALASRLADRARGLVTRSYSRPAVVDSLASFLADDQPIRTMPAK